MESTEQQEINCSICERPVDLEIAKTDDVGKAVHEECYVRILVMKHTTEPPKALRLKVSEHIMRLWRMRM